MQLDSEIQRQQLLACIRDTHITGTFQQVAEAVPVIQHLMQVITSAEIQDPGSQSVLSPPTPAASEVTDGESK